MKFKAGMFAYLVQPLKRNIAVTLLEKSRYGWIIEICGTGYVLEVYEDELEL